MAFLGDLGSKGHDACKAKLGGLGRGRDGGQGDGSVAQGGGEVEFRVLELGGVVLAEVLQVCAFVVGGGQAHLTQLRGVFGEAFRAAAHLVVPGVEGDVCGGEGGEWHGARGVG